MASPQKNEVIFSGIKFADFMQGIPIPIENILLPNPMHIGKKYYRKFELLEGKDDIAKLKRQNISNYGDFCFIDYANMAFVSQLTEEQLAELLYLFHMFKPLQSPFFKVLQNNYVYLSHDDGWYCKLYCKDEQIPVSMLINKLLKSIQESFDDSISSLPNDLISKIAELSTQGLLVQLTMPKRKLKNGIAIIKLYDVGEYQNIDDLFNNIDDIKLTPSFEVQL